MLPGNAKCSRRRRGYQAYIPVSKAAFLTSFPRETQNSSKFGHQLVVVMNYACAFS